MSSHGSTHGAKAVSSKAMGMMMTNLLTRLPIAIFPTIGNSRAGVIPCTYWGVTAASSITTPAVFALALTAAVRMSSTTASKPTDNERPPFRASDSHDACRSTSCTLVQHRLVDNRVAFTSPLCRTRRRPRAGFTFTG